MQVEQAIAVATKQIEALRGRVFDVLTVAPPESDEEALGLVSTISKLSPFLGNMIEVDTAATLNQMSDFQALGRWVRQDPTFPDVLFCGSIDPAPGFEVKAWFPLATEITARFKDSQSRFPRDETQVAMVAWLPEHLIFGRPRILDVVIVSARSVAAARDGHYHNPPDYLVVEPRDTAARTRNLQQTNTSGYKFQGSAEQFEEARTLVESWGADGCDYVLSRQCQERVEELMQKFPYRLDTNYGKMDRVEHGAIEAFKLRVRKQEVAGKSVAAWAALLASNNEAVIAAELSGLRRATVVGRDR